MYKVNKGNVVPKLVSYKVESEEEVDESNRAISPLYEDSERPPSALYEEVVIDEWPPIKEEVDQESDQENVQQTPPRRVVFEETVRTTPFKQRVGLKNSEKRVAQKTKSAKERLGTKPSNFRPKNQEQDNHVSAFDRLGERRGNVFDRIQPIPGEDLPSQGSTFIRQRIGKTNTEQREAKRKTRNARDQASFCQVYPREAKGSRMSKSEHKNNQIDGYIFQNQEEDTTDSEEDTYKSSKSRE